MDLTKKDKELIKKIKQLKKEKKAVILVHNYQRPEIYEVADFIGDSLELARKASEVKNSKLIVFCGVDFMAESAAILNPGKKVLLPVLDARCPMAGMVDLEGLRELKRMNPDAAVVCYVNTTAEVKAESDICCTSSNAIKIVNSVKQDKVIFVPDMNLANYVKKYSYKKIIPWKGFCYVHDKFLSESLKLAKSIHPNAEVVVHPECRQEIIELADHACSTSKMIDYVKQSKAKEFIIGTEVGMIERLKREFPDKKFYAAPPGGTCIQMKKNSLEAVLKALEEEKHIVNVPKKTAEKAKLALERMLEISR